jgi:hypothetical protein
MKGWPRTSGSQFFELRVIAIAIQPDRPYVRPTSDKQKQRHTVVIKDVFSTQSATGGVRAFQNECRDLRAAAIRAALSIIDEGM